MALTDFVVKWNDYLTRTNLEVKFDLVRLPVPDNRLSAASSQFLTGTGMPDAAGFYFHDLTKGLRKIFDVYNPGNSDYWTEQDRQRLDSYLMLGSDDAGNPLCLDLANDENIIFLDHEARFEEGQFVNSGVSQLAECILVYQEMVEKYQNEFGEEAELYEGNVPTLLVEETLDRIGLIDPLAVGVNCHWPTAADHI